MAQLYSEGRKNADHSDDDGINVRGSGHVVAYNRISGYGDAMKTSWAGARALDFYGNDILWTYDNGVELDQSEGNVRCFRNRFTNTYAALSLQPVYGGPAYLFRNVVVNVANEQLKFHPLNTSEPSGLLVYHNTFVSPGLGLNLQSSATSHYFAIENNLFVGPWPQADREVDWSGNIDHGTFDYNGYYPDAQFSFTLNKVYRTFANFARMHTAGLEPKGRILLRACENGSPFVKCLTPPPSYTTFMAPQDVTPAIGSGAIDAEPRLLLPNVNIPYAGLGPDLAAIEVGCAQPMYGPRPPGVDESSVYACTLTGASTSK